MTTNPNETVVDQTTYTQLQIPGVDWSQYDHREVPTDEQIIDSLPSAEYYEHFAQTLWEQYSLVVSPGQLRTSEFMARKSYYVNILRQSAKAGARG